MFLIVTYEDQNFNCTFSQDSDLDFKKFIILRISISLKALKLEDTFKLKKRLDSFLSYYIPF